MTDLAPLRERIEAMRASALEHLEHQPAINGGMLGIVADCTRVLALLPGEGTAPDRAASGQARLAREQARVVVSDDNVTVRVAIYAAGMAEPLAVADLSVPQMVQVAHELTGAASRHMGASGPSSLGPMRNHAAGVRRGDP